MPPLPTNPLMSFATRENSAVAVPHFSVSIVARGSGRSAVLSAAYRHCARMEFDREARTIDYTRKQGLLHEAFVIPDDAPEWVRSMIADRSVAGASETDVSAVAASTAGASSALCSAASSA